MALSVDYLYSWTLKLIRKNQSGGLASTEFCSHWNDAQGSYQDDLMGRFQAKNTGKEGANTGLIENETIMTKLTPFIKPVAIIIAAGQNTKPADFVYTLALRINGHKVFKVNQDAIWAMINDVIDPPSISDDSYYYAEYLNYYKFFPIAVTAGELDYISTPIDIFWAYTLDGNGRQVYNSALSINPQWDQNSSREITKRMLDTLGVSYSDEDLSSFGSKVQQIGE